MSTYIDRLRSRYSALQDPRVSDEQILRLLPRLEPERFGGMAPEQVSAAALNDDWAITRGFKAGVDQLQGLGGGLLALAGDAAGSNELRDKGLDIYDRNQQEAAFYGRPEFLEVDDGASALEWAGYTLGNLAPMIASSLAGGGIGGLVARKGAEKVAGKLVADQVAKGVARDVAQREAGKAIARRIATGQGLGAFGASSAMGVGEIYGDTEDVSASLLHGTVVGMLDALPIGRALNRLGVAPAAKEAVKRSVAGEVLKQGAAEFTTEGLQTLVEQHARHWVETDGRSLLENPGAIDWREVIEASAAGALGGGAMGGGGQLLAGNPGADDLNTRIENAGARAVEQGGDALEAELAKAEAAAREAPRAAAEAQSRRRAEKSQVASDQPGAVDPAADILTAADLGVEVPEASAWGNTDRPKVQSWQPDTKGIEDAAREAEAFGQQERSIRLRNLQRLYQRAARLLADGQEEAGLRIRDRANAIHETLIGSPAPEPGMQLPMVRTMEGPIEGSPPAVRPDAPVPADGIEIRGRRAPGKVSDARRRALPAPAVAGLLGNEGMIYGEAPPGRDAARESTRRAMEDPIPTGTDWRPGVDARLESEATSARACRGNEAGGDSRQGPVRGRPGPRPRASADRRQAGRQPAVCLALHPRRGRGSRQPPFQERRCVIHLRRSGKDHRPHAEREPCLVPEWRSGEHGIYQGHGTESA
jgi:hypothetical protein